MGPQQKLRRRVKRMERAFAYQMALAPLRDAGKRCGTCQHYERTPYDRTTHHCSIDSDFSGYTIVKADHLCLVHTDKA